MKKKLYGILCVLGLFSCQNSDTIELTEEKLTFNVKEINEQKTRAGNDHIDDIKNSDTGFRVFVSTGELQASDNLFVNKQIKWDGASWQNQTDGSPMLWGENQSLNIYAQYPYVIPNPNPYMNKMYPILFGSISNDQRSEEKIKANDLIVAHHLNETSSPINLIFQHVFAKVRFHINSNGNGLVESANIYCNKLTYEYNLNTQLLTSKSHYNADVQMYCYNQTENSAITEVILTPCVLQKIKSPFCYIQTVKNGVVKQYKFSLAEDISLIGNTIYNFNISLVDNEIDGGIINTSDVTIAKWTENLLPNILIPSK